MRVPHEDHPLTQLLRVAAVRWPEQQLLADPNDSVMMGLQSCPGLPPGICSLQHQSQHTMNIMGMS